MINNLNMTAAINARCKVAMQLAGYAEPRVVSADTENPMRPACQTMVIGTTSVEAGGMFSRKFGVVIAFYPENEHRPFQELKVMDDCMTQAFLNPIEVDGYRNVLPTEKGVTNEIDHGCLLTAIEYEFPVAAEELAIDPADLEMMERLTLTTPEEG